MSSTECNLNVYKYGIHVGTYDMPKEKAELLRVELTEETGCLHDWHYVGGRVIMKALPKGFDPLDPEGSPKPEGYGAFA